MARIISVHEYVLKAGADEALFEDAIQRARSDHLLSLPGLVQYYFIKGIKGARRNSYTAIWVFESRDAWERLWGPPDHPIPREGYPENWKVWEDQVLAPFLEEDPDSIRFTSYEELEV